MLFTNLCFLYSLYASVALQFEPDNKQAKEDLAGVDKILEQRIHAAAEAEARLEEERLKAQQEILAARAKQQAAGNAAEAIREGKKPRKTKKNENTEAQATKNNLQVAKSRPGWLFGLFGLFGIAGVAAFGLIRFFKAK